MASLEDKLLGEKLDYYCSSSSEDESNDHHQKKEPYTSSVGDNNAETEASNLNLQDIYSVATDKTGPKGVIADFRRYQQLERENRSTNSNELGQLSDKYSKIANPKQDEDDFDFENDPILQQLMQQKLDEMKSAVAKLPRFGQLYEIESANYVDTIDNENPRVTIIIHLYDDTILSCRLMTACLKLLAKHYYMVMFCNSRAASIPVLSSKFTERGLPALLLYRGGALIGNFIRVTESLGEEFHAIDVENYLLEHAMLPLLDKTFAECVNADSDDD